jgi:iron-sulfur cluster repair protein YtfE (RIC family)
MLRRSKRSKVKVVAPKKEKEEEKEEDVINVIKKLKIKNWTGCIQGCNKWKLYVEKVKTFKD